MRILFAAALIIAAGPAWAQYQSDWRNSERSYERQNQRSQTNRSNSFRDNRPYYPREQSLGDSRPYRRTDPRRCTSILCD